MTTLNFVDDVVVGEYGNAIILQLVDHNGTAVDISAYTTSKTVTLRDPFSIKTVSKAATFVTDGTDGKIQFTPSAGDLDRPGTWEGQVKLESGSAVASSVIFDVEVENRISASS